MVGLGVKALLVGGPLNGVVYNLPENFTFGMRLRIRHEGFYEVELDADGRLVARWTEA